MPSQPDFVSDIAKEELYFPNVERFLCYLQDPTTRLIRGGAYEVDYTRTFLRDGEEQVETYEVKGESYGYHNIALEFVSNTTTGRKGCFLTSEADWWLHVFWKQPGMPMLIYPLKPFREWVLRNTNQMKPFETQPQTHGETGVRYTSTGFLCPCQFATGSGLAKCLEIA